MVTTNQRCFYDFQQSLGGLDRDDVEANDPEALGYFDMICCGPTPDAQDRLEEALSRIPDIIKVGKKPTPEEVVAIRARMTACDKTWRLWSAYSATPEDLALHWTDQGWYCHIYKAKSWASYCGPRFMKRLKDIVAALPASQPRWTMQMVAFDQAVIFGSVSEAGIAPFKDL